MKEVDPTVYLFLLILAVGLVLFFVSSYFILRGLITLRWKPNHAYIEHSEYSGSDNEGFAGVFLRSLLGFLGSAPSHKASVRYRYFVMEKEFFGERIQIGRLPSGDRNRIEKFLSENTKGEVVEIYYNPVSPKQSVIKKGPSSDSVKMLGLGIIMIGIGGYISSVFFAV